MFAEIYRQQLSKRLLNQKSASDDNEKNMIGKLKLKCGAQFTAKMEGMMNDLVLGVEHGQDFDAYFKEARPHLGLGTVEKGVEFSVNVLTNGNWPSPENYNVALPVVMVKCQDTFKNYYVNKHDGRRLEWFHGLGTVNMKGAFQGRKKIFDLKITTLQVCRCSWGERYVYVEMYKCL